MITRTLCTDFKDVGGRVDWKAYNKAQVSNGESCRKCNGYISYAKGFPALCWDCEELATETGEINHNTKGIRCPSCRYVMTQWDDHYELYEDGEHDFTCHNCDHTFMVSTNVEYSWSSPAVLKVEDDPEDEDPDDADSD